MPGDGDVLLGSGQRYVVPRGVEHRPIAEVEAHVPLIDPNCAVNTDGAGGPRTAGYDDSLT